MTPTRLNILIIVFFYIIDPSVLQGGSRVAFSRPGSMMKIPTSTGETPSELFTVGASSEIFKTSPLNQGGGVFLNAYLSPKFNLGFSAVSFANPVEDLEADSTYIYNTIKETGIHFQYTVYVKNSVSIGVGIQDILLRTDEKIDQDAMSMYAVFSSERNFDDYSLGSYLGFGTGKIGADTNLDSTDLEFVRLPEDTIYTVNEALITKEESSAGVFLGFILKTPYMQEFGGIDFMAEYDGAGLNLGLKVPITKDYKLMFGITHFENFGEFGAQSHDTEPSQLTAEAPSISVGFSMSIPGSFDGSKPSFKKPRQYTNGTETKQTHQASQEQLETLSTLRDSLRLDAFQIENLTEHNAQMEQQINALVDSTRVLRLEKQVFESNLNKTMRHLSRSLRHYYASDYMAALQEVELALQYNPELAVAYARRGSIYFKLGDEQKATINWNLALKLDPEYEEVRKILQALHENRLKSATTKNDPNGL